MNELLTQDFRVHIDAYAIDSDMLRILVQAPSDLIRTVVKAAAFLLATFEVGERRKEVCLA